MQGAYPPQSISQMPMRTPHAAHDNTVLAPLPPAAFDHLSEDYPFSFERRLADTTMHGSIIPRDPPPPLEFADSLAPRASPTPPAPQVNTPHSETSSASSSATSVPTPSGSTDSASSQERDFSSPICPHCAEDLGQPDKHARHLANGTCPKATHADRTLTLFWQKFMRQNRIGRYGIWDAAHLWTEECKEGKRAMPTTQELQSVVLNLPVKVRRDRGLVRTTDADTGTTIEEFDVTVVPDVLANFPFRFRDNDGAVVTWNLSVAGLPKELPAHAQVEMTAYARYVSGYVLNFTEDGRYESKKRVSPPISAPRPPKKPRTMPRATKKTLKKPRATNKRCTV